MIASVHIADVGVGSALRLARRAPKPGSIPGLRHANVALAAPLGGSMAPKPQLGRIGLIAFWDDDAAVERFLAGHPLAAKLAGGWHSRLEPLRAFGTWPGLPTDVPRPRVVPHEGPAAVLTLGRMRLTQAVRFLKASNKAENGVLGADGLVWATGMARPPFVATCSLWQSSEALSAYAYGSGAGPHPDAITDGRVKPFHHEQAFIRFRLYASAGSLSGKNPLSFAAQNSVNR
jgi:hypothetical protein